MKHQHINERCIPFISHEKKCLGYTLLPLKQKIIFQLQKDHHMSTVVQIKRIWPRNKMLVFNNRLIWFCGKEIFPFLPRFVSENPTGSNQPRHCWQTEIPRYLWPSARLPWPQPSRQPQWNSLVFQPQVQIRCRVILPQFLRSGVGCKLELRNTEI